MEQWLFGLSGCPLSYRFLCNSWRPEMLLAIREVFPEPPCSSRRMKVSQTSPCKESKPSPRPQLQNRLGGTRGIQISDIQRGAEKSWCSPFLWAPSQRAEHHGWVLKVSLLMSASVTSVLLCPAYPLRTNPCRLLHSTRFSSEIIHHLSGHSDDKCLMWQNTVIFVSK